MFNGYVFHSHPGWNIQSRLAWNIPYDTHTYLIESYFNQEHQTLRNQILSRYSSFAKKLLHSPSKEIVFLANLVMRDARSTTCSNILYLNRLTNVDVMKTSASQIKLLLPVLEIPDTQMFRTGLLDVLMSAYVNKTFNYVNLDRKSCIEMIKSLCSS